ncbi:hypothetical protein ACJ72_07599 [Emergomyces africanus]|uniref:GPI anchored cell wall protein n=1 Tax=Emergomyces africanus TaxID=1955775 RepID=A0A1B7NMP6_9EURO|nr:hypothetical protein ACJ72_07599 [Emergomyces africanus]
MMKTTFLSLCLAALGVAQMSTTVVPPTTTTTPGPITVFQLIVPNASPLPSEASIIDVGPDAITFGMEIGCVPNLANGRCIAVEDLNSITLVQGPKTYSQAVSLSGAMVEAACSLDGTTLADCTVMLKTGDVQATVKTTITGRELESGFHPVTATAGLEKLTRGPSNAGPKATGNAGPRATGNAKWAVGGAAAAFAMVAAL